MGKVNVLFLWISNLFHHEGRPILLSFLLMASLGLIRQVSSLIFYNVSVCWSNIPTNCLQREVTWVVAMKTTLVDLTTSLSLEKTCCHPKAIWEKWLLRLGWAADMFSYGDLSHCFINCLLAISTFLSSGFLKVL